MNERIKQLAEQAEQYADDTFNSDPVKYDTPGQMKVWQELMQEKFAELIVRECIDILPEKVKIDDLYDGKILVQCGMAIKEHFGVEE